MSVHTHTHEMAAIAYYYICFTRVTPLPSHTHGDFELSTGRLQAGHPSTGGEEVEHKHLHSMLTIFALTLAHARSPISTLQWHYIYVKCAQTATNSSPPVAVIAAPCVHLAGKTVFGRVCSGWVWRRGGEESKRPSIMRETCALYVFAPRPPAITISGARVNGQRHHSRRCRRRN